MLKIQDLDFGFNGADNYKRSENKSFLNKVFFRTEELDKLCERNTFFLIGEKGTGKTACAVYLSNNDYQETLSTLNDITETDYQKFVQMKNKEHLVLSDYVDIWKVLIYLLLSKNISNNEPNSFLSPKSIKFRNVKAAVEEYYAKAFSPEIINAIKFVEKSKIAAELISKGFLRYSLYRPRDIVTMLSILQENFKEQKQDPNRVFCKADFFHVEFVRKYSEYLLGEIKDQLSFYYTSNDYELFLKFFEYLKGKSKFSYDEYIGAYHNFVKYLDSNSIKKPKFSEAPDVFLQFLYELNVIFYIEKLAGGNFIRLCLRERSPTNISPKVKTHQTYQVHYGLIEALNVGRKYTALEAAFQEVFTRGQRIENQ